MAVKQSPYIVIQADAPLDSRWTADLWFAWSRLLGQCRLKRACTAETWPAAVLRLRTIEAAAILAVHPNKVRWMLDRLVIPASMTARCERDHGGDLWLISVAKYAEYQKLGRPTSALSSAEVMTPPNVPTSQRPNNEEKRRHDVPSPKPANAAPPGTAKRGPTDPPERLTDEQRQALDSWCAEKHPGKLPRIRDLEEACLDYFRGRGKRHRDWVATVRTWVRNERASPAGVSGVAQRAQERAELMANNAREAIRNAEERERRRQAERQGRADRGPDADVRRLRADADYQPPGDVRRGDPPVLALAARRGDS